MSSWSAGVFLLLPLLAGVRADCVKGFQEVGRGLPTLVITPPEPLIYMDILAMCALKFGLGGLLQLHSSIPDEDKKKCGDALVPIYISLLDFETELIKYLKKPLTQDDLKLRDESYPRLTLGYGAMNLSSGLWHLVSIDYNHTCGICKLPPLTDKDFNKPERLWGDWDLHRITLRSLDIYPGPVNSSVDKKEILLEEIKKVTALIPEREIDPDQEVVSRTASVGNGYQLVYIFEFFAAGTEDEESQCQPVLDSAKGNEVLRKYDMKIENVNKCSKVVTAVGDRNTTVVPAAPSETQRSMFDQSTGIFTRRVCEYNSTEDRYVWSTETFWEFAWEPCTLDQQLASEVHYYEYLDTNQKKLLQQLSKSPVNDTTLDSLANALNSDIFMFVSISKNLTKEVGAILLQFPVSQREHSHVVSKLHVQLVAIDLEMEDPSDGISISYNDSELCYFRCPSAPLNIHLTTSLQTDNRIAETERERFSVKLSRALISISKRLAFVVFWEVKREDIKYLDEGFDAPRDIVINIALRLKENVGTLFVDAEEYYVDVSFKSLSSAKGSAPIGCLAWNVNLDSWSGSGCHNLKADRSNLTVFRCKAKYFQQSGDMLTAKYGILESSAFLSDDQLVPALSIATKLISDSIFTISSFVSLLCFMIII